MGYTRLEVHWHAVRNRRILAVCCTLGSWCFALSSTLSAKVGDRVSELKEDNTWDGDRECENLDLLSLAPFMGLPDIGFRVSDCADADVVQSFKGDVDFKEEN